MNRQTEFTYKLAASIAARTGWPIDRVKHAGVGLGLSLVAAPFGSAQLAGALVLLAAILHDLKNRIGPFDLKGITATLIGGLPVTLLLAHFGG
jgi:hypothetical protein